LDLNTSGADLRKERPSASELGLGDLDDKRQLSAHE
jgi:hypothetical protein